MRGFFAALRMTNKRGSNGDGAGLVLEIPPIANCAMDGARAFVLVVWLWRTGNGKCASKSGCCHSVSANSLCLPLRGSLNYLDAFFFFAAGFFVVFFAAFFVDFFVATAEPPGLTTPISFVPMGEPRPVQASQPGPALKPTGVPV